MDVVVGTVFPQNNTPVFVPTCAGGLRPFWDVPRSIVHERAAAEDQVEPQLGGANGFEIVRGQGDDGAVVPQSVDSFAALESRSALAPEARHGKALGNAKFLFPNR